MIGTVRTYRTIVEGQVPYRIVEMKSARSAYVGNIESYVRRNGTMGEGWKKDFCDQKNYQTVNGLIGVT